MEVIIYKYGENTITITVTAENGSKNYYVINVTRNTAVSAKLIKLDNSNGYSIIPNFSQNNNNYMIEVDNEITNLDLIIETLDPNATYKVTGNENFEIGNNIIEIEVTASDKLTKENYTINVNRKMSTNNYLSYILPSVGTLTPSFIKTTNNYVLTVENSVSNILIDAEPEDNGATMMGNGLYNLEVRRE